MMRVRDQLSSGSPCASEGRCLQRCSNGQVYVNDDVAMNRKRPHEREGFTSHDVCVQLNSNVVKFSTLYDSVIQYYDTCYSTVVSPDD